MTKDPTTVEAHRLAIGYAGRVVVADIDISLRSGQSLALVGVNGSGKSTLLKTLAGLLEPILKDITVGAAEVRKIFELSKGAPVAGCMVVSGRIVKGKVRVRRRKEIIYEGLTQSLRRFQDEVNEVRAGMECGIRIEGFGDYQIGDAIECYTMEKVAQKL